MKVSRLLPALLLLAPAWAQDDKAAAAPAMPNPKHAEHDALKPFVGTWTCNVKMTEGGKTSEMAATETFELLLDGIWLKSTVNSTYQGQPFQGLSLMGFDPKTKKYVGIWADSMTPTAATSELTYDAKTKTWNSKTLSGHGPTRTVLVWKNKDSFVETGYKAGPDGKETVVMEITRTRGGNPPPAPATEIANVAKTPAPAAATSDPAQAELTKHLGKWTAVCTMPGPDGKMHEEKGTETCTSVCNGTWQWTHYKGTMMGQPFEGYGLVGYDPESKQVTTHWIDSCSPYLFTLNGKYDSAAKGFSCSGTGCCPEGTEMSMTQTTTWKDADTRVCKMACKSKDGPMDWEIVYTRAK
jgi:hypothetical protein